MVLRHKLNDVLETEMQMFPFPSRKKKFQLFGIWKRKCVSWKHVSVSIKKHVSVLTEAGNGNALRFHFRFQETKTDYSCLIVCLWSIVQTMIPPKQSGSKDPSRSFAGQLTRGSKKCFHLFGEKILSSAPS